MKEIINWEIAKVRFEGSNNIFEISLNKLLFKIRVHRIILKENKGISVLAKPEIYCYVNFERVKNYLLEIASNSEAKTIQSPVLTSMLIDKNLSCTLF